MTDQPKPFRPAEGRPHIADMVVRNEIPALLLMLAEHEERAS